MKKLNQAVDRFCILHPGFGIPNLMLYIVLGNLAVYLLSAFSSDPFLLTGALAYSLPSLLKGQIWRIITFIFLPSGSGILFFFYCYFTYSMGRTLEQQWGTAKFTCYYLGGVLLTVAGVSIASLLSGVGFYIGGSNDITFAMFLAFAVLFPDATFVLFPLPIPIRAKYIAWFDLIYFAYMIVSPILRGSWYAAVVPLMALLNVSIMIWPEMSGFLHLNDRPSRQGVRFRSASAANARREAQQASAGLRRCAVCGRSNQSNPELEFRYCSRCAGYHCFCSDHLFSHVHFTDDQP